MDWNARYLEQDTPWDRGGPSPSLLAWLATIQPCSVAVPGCGRGHEVIELASRGFEVTAIDMAPRALELLGEELERRGLTARLVHSDVLSWTPDEPLRAVYEQTCFCAMDPSSWKRYEERLSHWLAPGGVLAAAFMQTFQEGGPPFHCPLDTMQAVLPASRWHWPERRPLVVGHPRGFIELFLELRRVI